MPSCSRIIIYSSCSVFMPSSVALKSLKAAAADIEKHVITCLVWNIGAKDDKCNIQAIQSNVSFFLLAIFFRNK